MIRIPPAVQTRGGDCSGIDAAIRAAIRFCLNRILDIVGVQKSYQGLSNQQCERLTTKSSDRKLQPGGTFLLSACCLNMLEDSSQMLTADNLKRMGVEGLVEISSDESQRGARITKTRGFFSCAKKSPDTSGQQVICSCYS